jgi:hypothetical protein
MNDIRPSYLYKIVKKPLRVSPDPRKGQAKRGETDDLQTIV